MSVQRRLAAILSADVAGYSRLMGADEVGTLASLKSHRAELIDPEVEKCGGRIVKLMGDGALVEFPSVVDAVQCAVAIQQGMAQRNEGVPEGKRIDFRIGVNLGDIIIDGDDIYGDGVNLAARIQELAEPGGVALSAVAHDQVEGKVEAAFADAGAHELKNIAKPVRIYRWADEAGAASAGDAPPPLPDKPSLAVLPFTNMSGDPEQGYFSDGITEDIITELSRFPALFVIARNSSFAYKGRSVNVGRIGRELGVAYVVEGSVRKAGNRVRVTAQLVETASGNHLWAERYDRDLADIFAVQDEVVETIANSLGMSLRDAALGQARTRPAGNLTAYDHLLRGRSAWWGGRQDEAFGNLELALAADPDYAAAHAWLALQYTYDGFLPTRGLTIEEHARRAWQHAEAALRLDERDAFVHMAVSMAFSFPLGGDRARGFRHSDAAVTLNPHDFEVMYCRAYVLARSGRCEEALEWLDKASRLNPITPYLISEGYCDVYMQMGEYEKALESIGGQGNLPNKIYIHIAWLNAQLGRMDEAKSCMTEYERVRPAEMDTLAHLRLVTDVFPNRGSYEEYVEILRQAGLEI